MVNRFFYLNGEKIIAFIFKLLSRTKAADDPVKRQEFQDKQKNKIPELEEFIHNRDYSGAIALLEVNSYTTMIIYFYLKRDNFLF